MMGDAKFRAQGSASRVAPKHVFIKANKARVLKNNDSSICGGSSSSSAGTKRVNDAAAGAIIEANRKTELCKNWPNCKYASRCAFAHSTQELRRLSLAEMETQGRIPCASKFRVFPCATFLATGSCPYRDRCVFIHDPRVKGSVDAYLYATPGTSNSNKEKTRSKGPLFWPDAQIRSAGDAAYAALYSAAIKYHVHPRNEKKPTYFELVVKSMWSSFTSCMSNLASLGDETNKELYTDASAKGRLPIFVDISDKGKLESLKQGLDSVTSSVSESIPGTPSTTPSTAPSSPRSDIVMHDCSSDVLTHPGTPLAIGLSTNDLNNKKEDMMRMWAAYGGPAVKHQAQVGLSSARHFTQQAHRVANKSKPAARVQARCGPPVMSPFGFPDLFRGGLQTSKLCSLH